MEYYYGKDAGQEYVRGTRMSIASDIPIIGKYGVNQRGSGDMYYKGGNMLNTLREVLNDDDKWRALLRGLNKEFYHQTVTTQQVEDYMAKGFGMDLQPIFDQYLRDVRIPILEYYFSDEKTLNFRWINSVASFDMPVDLILGEKRIRVKPTTRWSKLEVAGKSDVKPDEDYYVGISKMR